MKKLVYLMLLLPMVFFAQKKEITTTTDEEFNYLSNGYSLTVQNGLEIKKGYSLKLLSEAEKDGFNYKYFGFVNSDGITKAILVQLTKDKDSKYKIVFLCIPFNRPDLLKQYRKDKEKRLGAGMYVTYDSIDEILLSNYVDSKENH